MKSETTMRSMIVVSPSVSAKPLTLPTARMNSTAAARKLTVSDAMIVRSARFHPCSTDETRPRPSRSSSLMRSK